MYNGKLHFWVPIPAAVRLALPPKISWKCWICLAAFLLRMKFRRLMSESRAAAINSALIALFRIRAARRCIDRRKVNERQIVIRDDTGKTVRRAGVQHDTDVILIPRQKRLFF